MSALWTAAEIIAATGGTAASAGWSVNGVSIDSRTVAAGDLFVALAGPSFDGHDFIADALKRGAAGALVSHKPAGVAAEDRAGVVRDGRATDPRLRHAGGAH